MHRVSQLGAWFSK